MKKLKKWIIIILIMIIILVIILINILKSNKNHINDEMEVPDEEMNIVVSSNLQKVSVKNDYFVIKNIIQDYYSNISNLNTVENNIVIPYNPDMTEEDRQQYIKESVNSKAGISQEYLYSVLPEKYLENEKINLNSIKEKIRGYENFEILIDNMYFVDNSEDVSTYFVTGKYVDTKNGNISNLKLMVILDKLNSTYVIYPEKYIDYIGANNLKEGQPLSFELNISSIENKKYNVYNYEIVSDKDLSEYLVDLFKNNIKYNKNVAYSKLNKEYSSKKFSDITDFSKYLDNNKNRTRMSQYSVINNEGYTRYICIDSNENYYIFDFKSISDYDVMLDTYTINLPQFIEKYTISTIQEKVIMNIDKFIKALNDKDYKFAYNCLSDGFKNNKFKSIDIFEKFMRQNMFDDNVVEYEEFKNEGDTYIYNIVIKNSDNYSQTKDIQIIMKLGEGTDFVMSFNFP